MKTHVAGGLVFSVLVLICCCQTREGQIEPLMISNGPLMINESASVTLACPGSGDIYWILNETYITYSNTDGFSAIGFTITDEIVTVLGSPGSNNTNVTCEWIGGGDSDFTIDRSETTTIIVLSVPSIPNVTFINEITSSNSFTLTWPASYSPPGYDITQYTVTVIDTLSDITYTPDIMQAESDDRFTSVFVVPDDNLPLQLCSQFVFQVTATNDIGDSVPAVTTWENPAAPVRLIGAADDMKCVIMFSQRRKTATIQVDFLFPDICHFQNTSYTVSISGDLKTEGSSEGPIIHFGSSSRQVAVLLGPLTLEGKDYSATVDIEGFTGSVQSADTDCEFTISDRIPVAGSPSTDALNGNSERPVKFGPEVLAAVVLSVLIVLIVVIVNIVLLSVWLYVQNKSYKC